MAASESAVTVASPTIWRTGFVSLDAEMKVLNDTATQLLGRDVKLVRRPRNVIDAKIHGEHAELDLDGSVIKQLGQVSELLARQWWHMSSADMVNIAGLRWAMEKTETIITIDLDA